MLITIPFGFLRVFGPNVWRDINRYEDMVRSGKVSSKDEVGLSSSFTFLMTFSLKPP